MDVPVRLDLSRFVERSNGVFGKSGTGKSFLTRLLHCGIVASGSAVNLIFDMHNEYGSTSQAEGGYQVKGLRPLFGSRVQVYTLDPRSGTTNDGVIRVGLNEVEIEDVELLADELRLNATAVESAALCEARLGPSWIEQLTDDAASVAELNERVKAHEGSLSALQRKLQLIRRLDFVQPHVSERDSGLDRLIAALSERQHVVLEFGRQSNLLSYMLAANVITRRIHRIWTERLELSKQGRGQAPPQLMITIEEAHKFLNPRAASQTIFGTIARELRKYNVTLLVVDQRPSGIDDEVLSQLGTRITCALNDDKDIDATLAGVSGAGHLRAILASLDSRQQAMILGHAVPMPLALRTRSYDERFYAWVVQAASRRPTAPAQGWHQSSDAVAATVRPIRSYEDVFGKDE
jgi:DNA helicase HerA-like ATPase